MSTRIIIDRERNDRGTLKKERENFHFITVNVRTSFGYVVNIN